MRIKLFWKVNELTICIFIKQDRFESSKISEYPMSTPIVILNLTTKGMNKFYKMISNVIFWVFFLILKFNCLDFQQYVIQPNLFMPYQLLFFKFIKHLLSFVSRLLNNYSLTFIKRSLMKIQPKLLKKYSHDQVLNVHKFS